MGASSSVFFCLIGVIVLAGLLILTLAIRIVPEYKRLDVYRLGRSIGQKGPGLVILIPFVDRGVLIDVRDMHKVEPSE